MNEETPVACDLLVVGSGAAGMAAAITAKLHGLDVLLVEKADVFGGTTALSGGGLWVPGNPVSERVGLRDSRDSAREYMAIEAGGFGRPEMTEAFLEHGPAMVSFFEDKTAVRFVPAPLFPDYHPGQPGASQGGRTLYAAPYDGRELGARIKTLRPPLQEMTLFGLVTVSGDEVRHFLNATRSLRSARYVAGVFLRHLRDTLRHGRGMRLTNGNALAARLARSVFDLEIPLWLNAPVSSLTQDGARTSGAAWCWPAVAFRKTACASSACSHTCNAAVRTTRRHLPATPVTGSDSASRRAGASTRTWPTRPPGPCSRACRARTAAWACTRTSSTVPSPA